MSGELQKLTRQEAIKKFRPGVPSLDSEPKSDLERDLRTLGIAQVALSTNKLEFQVLSDQYGHCIDEYEDALNLTVGSFDKKGVPEDGHLSKTIDFNPSGMQIADPKSLFHFNNSLLKRLPELPKRKIPRPVREFLDYGFHLRDEVTISAMNLIYALNEESYVGIKELYCPEGLTDATLRLLRYDPYPTRDDTGKLIVEQNAQVAKPHYDRGGLTIQAYASAQGFWCKSPGLHGEKNEKIYPPYGEGQSQAFFGAGFRAIYGSRNNPIKPLYHGVDRRFDESLDYIPTRTAAILFTDAPLVEMDMKGYEMQRVDKENLDT
jgi:hypothetical protein